MSRQTLTVAQVLALPALPRAYETLMGICGVGKTTVAKMIKEGTAPVPVVPVAGQLRVRKADVLNFLGLAEETSAVPGVQPGTPEAGNDEAAGVQPAASVGRNNESTSK